MPEKVPPKLRAKKIKIILFDVDGVLTDGKIWIFPAPSASSGVETQLAASPNRAVREAGAPSKLSLGGDVATHQEGTLPNLSARLAGPGGFGFQSPSLIEAKGFHAHDGTAITLARLAGLKTGVITKRISETVALRARDLKMDHVYQGTQDKLTVFRQILEKEGIAAAEAAFVGDDVIDLPVMRKCGFAVAVENARPEVKAEAHWVTPHAGGDGAARDAVEYILKAQGKWKQVVGKYISQISPK
jgi:3-deoxy-D-manno-octulosonate 8-phosphate phosphatase (KDO 8-P phosphatase)